MSYPKKFMSITELVELGPPLRTLKQYARAKDAPVIKSAGGGKYFYNTDLLDDFLETMTIRCNTTTSYRYRGRRNN